MPRPAFPVSVLEFQDRFGTEEACRQYLIECRWPEGFRCPSCHGERYWVRTSRPLLECASCGRQVSATAGTIMHRTRTSLRLWFWAAYLVTITSTGISAVSLQRQLGLSRYETAWMMLHRLRRAMVNAERAKLAGEVEVDEFELGGVEPGRKGGRQKGKAVRAVIAAEVRGKATGRIRVQVIPDATSESLIGFITGTVEAGAVVHTDGWPSYIKIGSKGYTHRPRSQLKAKRDGDTDPVLPRAHRAISNLKAWHHGTHRWVSPEHTQAYFDEYVFRHNRRNVPQAAFQTLLDLGSAHEPITQKQIIAEGPGRPRKSRS